MKAIVLLALLGVAGCASSPADDGDAPTFQADALATLKSATGSLAIEVRTSPSQPPDRGETAVELRVTGPDGDAIDGLTTTPDLWMPEMGHGASTLPIVSADDEGNYVFERCELFMPGKWELRVHFTGAALPAGGSVTVDDDATARFEIP